ncbi:hypothetical protein Tco_0199836 [Tanacetum coccineum]
MLASCALLVERLVGYVNLSCGLTLVSVGQGGVVRFEWVGEGRVAGGAGLGGGCVGRDVAWGVCWGVGGWGVWSMHCGHVGVEGEVVVEYGSSICFVEKANDSSNTVNERVPVSDTKASSTRNPNTKIHVDNESAICVVKNPVYHSKTKHIEIRHHFIRDSYEKRLIEMVKIHTDNNVVDLLTKAFDGRLMVFKCSGVYTSAIWIEVGSVERAITTAASLDAAQDSDNIIRTQITTMPNVDIPQGMDTEGHTFGSGEGRMEHQFELTVNVSITPHDSPLPGGYTPGIDEGRLKLQELMTIPLVVVGEGSEQPTEPQPTSSTAPQEILTQVATATASQPPKDPNTYRRTKKGWNTKVPQSGGSSKKVSDEAINEEMLDSVERAFL